MNDKPALPGPTVLKVERYGGRWPVYGDVDAGDEDFEAFAVESWRGQVRAIGATPSHRRPSIEWTPNPHFGYPLLDEYGEQVLDHDGEPAVDQVRWWMSLVGRVVRSNIVAEFWDERGSVHE